MNELERPKENQFTRFVLAALALFALLSFGCFLIYFVFVQRLNALQLEFRKPVIQAQVRR